MKRKDRNIREIWPSDGYGEEIQPGTLIVCNLGGIMHKAQVLAVKKRKVVFYGDRRITGSRTWKATVMAQGRDVESTIKNIERNSVVIGRLPERSNGADC